jgi:hypothetical protein
MLPFHADPDEVIRRTTPLLISVHNAFDASCLRALDFFTIGRGRRRRLPEPEDVNSSLASALVRFYVREVLNEKGIETTEEDFTGLNLGDVPFDLDNLPNNGILLKYGDCHFRLRKKYYGRLPNPATSAMQDFYQQTLPFGPVPVNGTPPPPLKLMILWNRDSHFRFAGLELVLPIDGGPKFAEWEWRRRIPHPATLLTGKTQVEDGEELPYSLQRQSTGTEPTEQ